jgi:hypothetical protein
LSTEGLLKEGAQLILSNTNHMTKADKDEAELKVLRPKIAANGATGLATVTNCIKQARASLATESPVLRNLASTRAPKKRRSCSYRKSAQQSTVSQPLYLG